MIAEFVSHYEYQISVGFLIMAGLSILGLAWIILASLIVSIQKRRGRIVRECIDYFFEKQKELVREHQKDCHNEQTVKPVSDMEDRLACLGDRMKNVNMMGQPIRKKNRRFRKAKPQ